MPRITSDTIQSNLSSAIIRGVVPPVDDSDIINVVVALCEAVNILNARTQSLMSRVKELESINNQEV